MNQERNIKEPESSRLLDELCLTLAGLTEKPNEPLDEVTLRSEAEDQLKKAFISFVEDGQFNPIVKPFLLLSLLDGDGGSIQSLLKNLKEIRERGDDLRAFGCLPGVKVTYGFRVIRPRDEPIPGTNLKVQIPTLIEIPPEIKLEDLEMIRTWSKEDWKKYKELVWRNIQRDKIWESWRTTEFEKKDYLYNYAKTWGIEGIGWQPGIICFKKKNHLPEGGKNDYAEQQVKSFKDERWMLESSYPQVLEMDPEIPWAYVLINESNSHIDEKDIPGFRDIYIYDEEKKRMFRQKTSFGKKKDFVELEKPTLEELAFTFNAIWGIARLERIRDELRKLNPSDSEIEQIKTIGEKIEYFSEVLKWFSGESR